MTQTNPLGVRRCENCKVPADNPLCWRCVQTLRGLLHDQRTELLGELEIQILKQNVAPRQPGGSGGKKLEYPVLYNIAASELLDEILETLAELTTKALPPRAAVHRTLGSLSRPGKARVYLVWLEKEVVALGRVEGAFAEVRDINRQILQIVDRRAQKLPIGICPTCSRGIFALPDQAEAECCGNILEVEKEREKLNALARNQLVSAKEAVLLGENEGVHLNANTIRSWVSRDLLEPRLPKRGGQPAKFRFGDLLDLARASDSPDRP